MGSPQSSTSPHMYSPSLQLKLYQAFIFSIPILFSIILFLLFYLFYLKRRNSSSPALPISGTPRTPTQGVSSNSLVRNIPSLTFSTSSFVMDPLITYRSASYMFMHPNKALMGLKGILKDKIPVIIFDEDSTMEDTQCCVCLGEFELKEELHQLPVCQHVFHKDCIRHWFHSSSTCPLCRCPVVIINSKTIHQQQQPPSGSTTTLVLEDNNNENTNLNNQQAQPHMQQAEHVMMSISNNNNRDSQMVPPAEGSSRTPTASSRSESRSFSTHSVRISDSQYSFPGTII